MVELAKYSDLTRSVITLILDANVYMEGRLFMIDVITMDDVDIINKLLKLKTRK